MSTATYTRGPACPGCGSKETTLYPLDQEDAFTLYCDACKREEPLGWELRGTVDGRYMIVVGGFQWGPPGSTPDASGAYSDTWETPAKAIAAYLQSHD